MSSNTRGAPLRVDPMTAIARVLIDPSSGPAVMIKDTIDVAGVPTCAGSRSMADAPPATEDADVVRRMRAAGWRVTAKTKLHELAFGVTRLNAYTGSPINPRWPGLVPGGSSSGSASVVASGLVELAIGTDTGGSVRVPAACCGVIGFKPSFGAVSRGGVLPPGSSLDCVGPFARNMATIIKAMTAMSAGFSAEQAPSRIRVGLLDVTASAIVREAVADQLARARVETTAVGSLAFDDAYDAGITLINAENWAAFGPLVETGLLGSDIAGRLRAAGATTPADCTRAEQTRVRFTDGIDSLLAGCDVIALPTMATLPPRLEEADAPDMARRMTSLVRPFNLSGHPAISVPIKFTPDGPISIQLVAPRGADARLCAIAQQLFGDLAERLQQQHDN